MSSFLKEFKKMMDREFIYYEDWLDIVRNADEKTLVYLKENVMVDSLYGRRSSWLSKDNKRKIIKAIDKRLEQYNRKKFRSIVSGWGK